MWKNCAEVERFIGETKVSQEWRMIKNVRKERKKAKNINVIR